MKKTIIFILLLNFSYELLSHPGDHERGPYSPKRGFKKIEELDKKGDQLFKVVPNWGPHKPGAMHGGVVIDKKGNVYFSRITKGMVVLNKDGKKIGEWSDESAGIHGMNLYKKDGETFIVGAFDSKKKVASFNFKGEKQWEIGLEGVLKKYYEESEFKKVWGEDRNPDIELSIVPRKYSPTAVAVTSDGSCYVSDGYGQSLIHVFSSDRKYINTFAGNGLERDQVKVGHGITASFVKGKEVLLVSDRHRGRLVAYSLKGKYLYTALQDLPLPCAISINPNDGRIAIAGLYGSITIYDSKFNPMCRLGVQANKKIQYDIDPDKDPSGKPVTVHGLTWSKENGIIGVSWNKYGRIDYWKPIK